MVLLFVIGADLARNDLLIRICHSYQFMCSSAIGTLYQQCMCCTNSDVRYALHYTEDEPQSKPNPLSKHLRFYLYESS